MPAPHVPAASWQQLRLTESPAAALLQGWFNRHVALQGTASLLFLISFYVIVS